MSATMNTNPLWKKVKSKLVFKNCYVDISRCSFGLLFQVNTMIKGAQVVVGHVVGFDVLEGMSEGELVEMVSQGLNHDLVMDRRG